MPDIDGEVPDNLRNGPVPLNGGPNATGNNLNINNSN